MRIRVAVIGAGMGGLNAAIQLKHAGIEYVVIEKNSGVGGTWHEKPRSDQADCSTCPTTAGPTSSGAR